MDEPLVLDRNDETFGPSSKNLTPPSSRRRTRIPPQPPKLPEPCPATLRSFPSPPVCGYPAPTEGERDKDEGG